VLSLNEEVKNPSLIDLNISSIVPPVLRSLFHHYSNVLPEGKWRHFFFQFGDTFFMIPHEWRELFFQYLILSMKYKTLNEQKWKKEFTTFKSSASARFSNPDSPYFFEKNPITYLMYAHNCLIDFPSDLNRILKLIQQQRQTPIAKIDFLKILDRTFTESAARNWLNPALKELFGVLILYPHASTKMIAKRLNTTTKVIRERIERFRNRFNLNRIIHLNYYLVGLSRIYLFLRFRNRQNIEPALPVTTRYFEKETPHFPDTLSDLFCIQTYYTPKAQWRNFQILCENRFEPRSVLWLGDAPRLFFAEDVTILYNTSKDTYDAKNKQWCINEDYLAACLSTDLWEDLPRIDLSPALYISYDINSTRLDFDQLDLKIVHYFYELEGNNNRFSTVGAVAKELKVPYHEVKYRLQRMLETGMVTFYYHTTFRLPRTMDLILLSENPAICDQFINISYLLPVVSMARIRSYPSKYVGVFAFIWLPSGSRVPYIFRDFFRSHRDLITGFCAESEYIMVPKRPLWPYWNQVKKRWRWSDLPEI